MEQVNEQLTKYKIPLAFILVGIVLIIGGFFSSSQSYFPEEIQNNRHISDSSLIKQIKVDVSGAVKVPGVYTLDSSKRIEDAVKIAGGFSQNANKDYIAKSLNLSQKLSDGMKIYIPDTLDTNLPQTNFLQATNSKISINNATQKQLEDLPSVGPVTALKIIQKRPYGNIDELLSKKAVSNSTFGKIKDLIEI